MRNTILIAVGAALIAVATAQAASASDRHHARRVEHFRNANNAIVVPPQPAPAAVYPEAYSGGFSAPAGR
jgi:hypothetical protein